MEDQTNNSPNSPRRVLALGGSGLVGRYAVQTLLRLEGDVALTIADRDGVAAKRFADECGGTTSSLQLDVTDEQALVQCLSEHEVVMNTVGPYFRFGVPILTAAIAAGCDYLDVCDDWEPTLEMLELGTTAVERGVTALIGMGISPGVTNLLAARAIEELDEATSVVTGWDATSAKPDTIGPEPSAALVHAIEQLTGTIRVRRDGVFVDEKPIRAVSVDYPGVGPSRCWTIGHPEPLTLPVTYPEIRESVNAMLLGGGSAMALRGLGWLVDRGLVTKRNAAKFAERVEGPAGQDVDAMAAMDALARGDGLPPVFAWAEGVRNGLPERVGATLTATPPGAMGGATGLPLGVAAALLLRGEITRKGVHAPEACVPGAAFFDTLGPFCQPPRATMDEFVLVSTGSTETR